MAGKLFEELTVGQVFQHQPGRTVTEADNVFFSCLTMNPQPLHVDFHAAQQGGVRQAARQQPLHARRRRRALRVGETTLGTTVGNLGFEKVEFPKPVFHGDTIYSETEVVEKRESRSRPQWGIVIFEHRAKNQHGELVMRCRRAAMMRRRERLRVRRSLHFVPGGNEKMIAKALTLPADGLILDLEDAVAPDAEAGHAAHRAALARDARLRRRASAGCRMNPICSEHAVADLEETIAGRPDGYVVPKPRRAEDIRRVVGILERLEQKHGLPFGLDAPDPDRHRDARGPAQYPRGRGGEPAHRRHLLGHRGPLGGHGAAARPRRRGALPRHRPLRAGDVRGGGVGGRGRGHRHRVHGHRRSSTASGASVATASPWGSRGRSRSTPVRSR